MSAAMTLHRTTTNPSPAVVDCWACSRPGRWDWLTNTVRHSRRDGDVCVLPEPARKKELR